MSTKPTELKLSFGSLDSMVVIKKPLTSAGFLKAKKKRSKSDLAKFWTIKNDKLLVEYVASYSRNWGKIAEVFNNGLVTPKVVKDRYQNKFDKSIRRTRFSADED